MYRPAVEFISALERYDEPWFKFRFGNFYSSLLSGSASFLDAALRSPQRTKLYCLQIEYVYNIAVRNSRVAQHTAQYNTLRHAKANHTNLLFIEVSDY